MLTLPNPGNAAQPSGLISGAGQQRAGGSGAQVHLYRAERRGYLPPLTLQLLCRHHEVTPGAVGTAATEGLEPT